MNLNCHQKKEQKEGKLIFRAFCFQIEMNVKRTTTTILEGRTSCKNFSHNFIRWVILWVLKWSRNTTLIFISVLFPCSLVENPQKKTKKKLSHDSSHKANFHNFYSFLQLFFTLFFPSLFNRFFNTLLIFRHSIDEEERKKERKLFNLWWQWIFYGFVSSVNIHIIFPDNILWLSEVITWSWI